MSIISCSGKNDYFNHLSHLTNTLDRDTLIYTISGFPSFPSSVSIENTPVFLQKILCEVSITSSTGNNPILVSVLDTDTIGDLSGELSKTLFGLVINGSNNSLTSKNIDFPGMGLKFNNGFALFCEHSGSVSGFVRTSFFYRLSR